jgi:hypothetical protein
MICSEEPMTINHNTPPHLSITILRSIIIVILIRREIVLTLEIYQKVPLNNTVTTRLVILLSWSGRTVQRVNMIMWVWGKRNNGCGLVEIIWCRRNC